VLSRGSAPAKQLELSFKRRGEAPVEAGGLMERVVEQFQTIKT
jgi:hypothetical protein